MAVFDLIRFINIMKYRLSNIRRSFTFRLYRNSHVTQEDTIYQKSNIHRMSCKIPLTDTFHLIRVGFIGGKVMTGI